MKHDASGLVEQFTAATNQLEKAAIAAGQLGLVLQTPVSHALNSSWRVIPR
jgi:hypothetical protein